MNVGMLLEDLRARGVALQLDGDHLRVRAPRGVLTPELSLALKEHRAAIHALLSAAQDDLDSVPARPALPPIAPARRSATQPLSIAQERLWFMDALMPGTSLLNLPGGFLMEGPVDPAVLERALASIISRHDALRTEFRLSANGPVQVVLPEVSFNLEVVDLMAETAADPEAWRSVVRQRAGIPIALDRAPLLCAILFRLGLDKHAFLLVASHLVWDGLSFEVFLRELKQAYAAERGGDRAPTGPKVQYGDYVAWHEALIAQPWQVESLEYWKARLAGAPGSIELPLDRPRPAQMSYRGWMHAFDVPAPVAERVRAFAARRGATPFMVLLAGLDVVLSRYAGQRDVLVGAPVSGRARPELGDSIGMFVNTIVLRTTMRDHPSFASVLEDVKATSVAAFEHDHTPFERIVDSLRPPRDRSRTPLFQIMFGYRQVPRHLGSLGEARLSPLRVHAGAAGTDLTLWVEDDGQRLFCGLEFATDLFDLETIRLVADSLLEIWDVGSMAPELPVSELPLPESHRRALSALAATDAAYDRSRLLHRLFEARADEDPDRVAVIFEDRQVSYGELDARASMLARRLVASGVRRDVFVGVCVERSIELIVALLGVLKAGGAYVPLDPALPFERLDQLLEDSGARIVIASSARGDRLGDRGRTLIEVEGDSASTEAGHPGRLLAGEEDPSQLAYLIYTSGSTGKPKGVLVEHGNVLALLRGMEDVVDFEPAGVWLSATSISFDISVLEIFGVLTHGMTLVLLGEQRMGDAVREEYSILRCIETHGVTHFQCTPSQAALLLSDGRARTGLARLGQLLVGGEQMSEALAADLLAACPSGTIFNMYGPTETTIWATCHALGAGAGTVPIGRPLANVKCYVLDDDGRPVPVGAVGELFIGGDLVARGYHRLPELTEARFLVDPFRPAGGRMYRTGDRVRLAPGGLLEYRGRLDDQVKIRGYRVEPAEVVACLEASPGVGAAAVIATRDEAGATSLTAFVVPDDKTRPLEVDGLREQLRARLPPYMVPSRIGVLEALPQTPSGKVDRAALSAFSDWSYSPRGLTAAPRDDLDRALLGVWREVLGIGDIGIDDDFFDVGGHSLLGVRILSRIFDEQGVLLSLGVLFEAPTVRTLSAVVRREQVSRDERAQGGWSAVVPIQPKGSLPPFFCAAGRGGNPMNLRHVAWSMGSEQPFYGLQHRGVDGRSPPHASLFEMAAEMAEHLRQVQPEGPYYVGGFSGGGVVAMEVARALLRAGEDVALLVLLESSNPAMPAWTLRQRIEYHAGQLAETGGRHLVRVARRRCEDLAEAMRLGYARLRSRDDPFKYRNELVNLAYLEAARQYEPEPYDGDVALLRSRIRDTAVIDPENGWGSVVRGNLEVIEVGGGHVSFVEPPEAAHTARVLAGVLARARARHPMAPLSSRGREHGRNQVWTPSP